MPIFPGMSMTSRTPAYRSLSFALMLAFAGAAHASTYVWDFQKSDSEKRLPKVALTNKTTVEEVRGTELFEQSVVTRVPNSKEASVLVKNDFAQIAAAWPTPRSAAAVLVSDSCSGSICHWQNMTMVVPQGTGIKTYRLGSPTKVTLTLAGNEVVGGQADGIPAGEDKYGSPITTSRRFMPGAGFVAAGFKTQYVKLIGKHPEHFFNDPALREPLAKAAGLEVFRDLRNATSVASPVYLVDGRYIVVQGCVPHDCGGNYGFVMIDAVSADLYWARFGEGKNRYAGATRKADRMTMGLVLANEDFVHNDDARMTVSPAGKIVFQPASR